MDDDIGIANGADGGGAHGRAQLVVRIQEPWGVEQHELGVGIGEDSDDARPCGLRFGAGDREVFADAKGRITYGALKERIERCAEFLRRTGIKRGDVVTIQLPNRIDFPVVFFALELIGAIANKVNPDFRARELEYILKFSGSSAYAFPREFKSHDYVTMAKSLQQAVPNLKHLIVAGGGAEGIHDLDAGLRECAPISAANRVKMDPDEIFRMAFTSGTTGDPKCVLHSFNSTLYAAVLVNHDMKVTDKDVMLVYLPVGLKIGRAHV